MVFDRCDGVQVEELLCVFIPCFTHCEQLRCVLLLLFLDHRVNLNPSPCRGGVEDILPLLFSMGESAYKLFNGLSALRYLEKVVGFFCCFELLIAWGAFYFEKGDHKDLSFFNILDIHAT